MENRMENAFHALEIGFGIILFCVGLYMAMYMGTLLNAEYESVSITIYENQMIRRE